MWALVLAALAAGAPSGAFTAVDYAWRANGTDATSLTIAPGETVSFAYPSGASFHNLRFETGAPACTGVPAVPLPPGWSAECRFDNPGIYRFVCDVHGGMSGRVVVAAPPGPTPTPTPTPGESTPPGPSPSPTPSQPPSSPPAGGPAPPQTRLAVRLPRKQRGTRVRGSVAIERAGSRLEVILTARKRRVGRLVQRSTRAGSVRFAVRVDRTVLKRRLAVSVTIRLKPPGGRTLTRTLRTTITRG
jgi:plastocyanin